MSTLLNNNTVDGGDNNQAFFSEERGAPASVIPAPRPPSRNFKLILQIIPPNMAAPLAPSSIR